MSEFKCAYFCVACDGELTRRQVMYSEGVCPACGFQHERASTIVGVMTQSYKDVVAYSSPWWKLWETSTYRREYVEGHNG